MAWHYFALFAAVIAGLITEPLPGAAIGFIGVTVAAGLYWLGKRPARLRNSPWVHASDITELSLHAGSPLFSSPRLIRLGRYSGAI